MHNPLDPNNLDEDDPLGGAFARDFVQHSRGDNLPLSQTFTAGYPLPPAWRQESRESED